MTTKAFSNARINVTAQDKTKAAFSSVQKTIKSVTGVVFSLQSAVVSAAGIGGMGMLVKSSMEAADTLAKTADRIGTTTQSLAGLRHGAALAGVENAKLDTSLEKLNINLSKAVTGTGATAEAIDLLGLSADRLAKMSTDEAIYEIADAMVDVENTADRARIAQDLFGRSGLDMINMLAGGSEALKEAAEEADAFGTAISRVDAAKIEAANDAMYRAKQAVEGIGMSIAVELSPYIEHATNLFVNAAKEANGWRDEILSAIESIVMGIGYMLDVINGIQFAWYAAQLAFSTMAEIVMKGIEKIARPIVKLISLIPKIGVEYEKTMAVITEASEAVAEQSEAIFTRMEDVAYNAGYAEKVKEFFADIQEAAQEFGEGVAEIQETRQAAQRQSLAEHLDEVIDLEKNANDEIVKDKKKSLTELEKFMQMSYTGQTALVVGQMEAMTRGVSQSNKAMFAINKAAGIANAIINAHMAASMALATYPYPLGAVMAVLAYASGIAQVQAIRSTSFSGGGGGSAPSLGGSSGSGTPVYDPDTGGGGVSTPAGDTEPEQEVKEIEITLNGAGYSKENVRELIYQINEEVGDGVMLRAT